MKTFPINVNGHLVRAVYDENNIQNIFVPLLKKWTKMQHEANKRLLILLAAPPGTGKTTLSLFLEHLSKNLDDITPIQAVGMDGFHRYQDYLNCHYIKRDGKTICMKDVKGCPETFDVDKLIHYIEAMKTTNIAFPLYDRVLHNPIENKIYIDHDIVLLEGNYLLLNEQKWQDIHLLFDDTIFITAPLEVLKKRLITRKMKGGTPYHLARQFYENSDGVNVKRVLENSILANIHLFEDNHFYQEI